MKHDSVGRDGLGNDLYVRRIDKSGCIRLPALIADYLRDKEILVKDANYKSDRDDLCATFLSRSHGFVVDYFSSNYLLVKAMKLPWHGIVKREHIERKFLTNNVLVMTAAEKYPQYFNIENLITALSENAEEFLQDIEEYESKRALNRACAFSEKLSLSTKNTFSLSDYWVKTEGYHDVDVVIRCFEHGEPPVSGAVQILPLTVWNKRFPDHAL